MTVRRNANGSKKGITRLLNKVLEVSLIRCQLKF